MELDKKLSLLKRIAEKFNEAKLTWALGASMMLFFNQLISDFHDIDIMLSGHQHDLWVFEPNILTPYEKLPYNSEYGSGTNKGQVTEFKFPVFLISKRGLTQTDSSTLTQKTQIGLSVYVDLNANTQTVIYNNSNGEKVNMINQFAEGITYGTDIVIDLETKVFTKR